MNSMSRKVLKDIVDAHGMASVLEALSRIADAAPASPNPDPLSSRCRFSSNGYTCTRPLGHPGDHYESDQQMLTACGSYEESGQVAGICRFCGYSRPAHSL